MRRHRTFAVSIGLALHDAKPADPLPCRQPQECPAYPKFIILGNVGIAPSPETCIGCRGKDTISRRRHHRSRARPTLTNEAPPALERLWSGFVNSNSPQAR